jgi:putative spermidine/putrescine transport system substrate-binding protein
VTTQVLRWEGRLRNALLTGIGAVALALRAAAASDLTVISFGRSDQQALGKAYFTPFQAHTGVHVRSLSYEGETTELDQMVKGGSPDWDVVQVESRTLQLGCQQGLFEKLDVRKIGNRSDFIPGAVSDCGVGIFAWAMGLAYDADKVHGSPKSWADLWDLKKYPGKRGLRRSAKYTLEIALLADGVAPADVYHVLATPGGVDRAFRKLDQIKSDILWWEAAPQPAAYLSSGNLVMTSAYTLWFEPDRVAKLSFRLAWDQSLYDVDSWAIPKGTPRAPDAYRFIAFASQPEQQKVLSDTVAYGPTNRKAVQLLDAQRAEAIPSAGLNLKHALKVDTEFWIQHGEELEKRFDQWAPQICRQQTDDDDNDYKDQAICQDVYGNLRGGKPASTHR